MNRTEAYQALVQQLETLYDKTEAANIADWVMEAVTGQQRRAWTDKAAPLSIEQQERWQQYTNELLQHRPVQYVLGECYFFDMKLYVDERVLIPRPETEELADWAIRHLKQSGIAAPVVLDIGTGSGCLALAIGKKCPGAEVHAIDLSAGALEVARRNAAEQGIDVRFMQQDILRPGQWKHLPQPHLLISNPPYITVAEQDSILPHVLEYEPHQALFVTDNDPLQFYKAIEAFAAQCLQPGGAVFLELHRDFARQTEQYYKDKGWATVLRKDMQGEDRMLYAARP